MRERSSSSIPSRPPGASERSVMADEQTHCRPYSRGWVRPLGRSSEQAGVPLALAPLDQTRRTALRVRSQALADQTLDDRIRFSRRIEVDRHVPALHDVELSARVIAKLGSSGSNSITTCPPRLARWRAATRAPRCCRPRASPPELSAPVLRNSRPLRRGGCLRSPSSEEVTGPSRWRPDRSSASDPPRSRRPLATTGPRHVERGHRLKRPFTIRQRRFRSCWDGHRSERSIPPWAVP